MNKDAIKAQARRAVNHLYMRWVVRKSLIYRRIGFKRAFFYSRWDPNNQQPLERMLRSRKGLEGAYITVLDGGIFGPKPCVQIPHSG